ncbi:MAG: hypothetical protein MUE69_09375 [Myxococcota bacterium]|jgi:hypothetical protein|nr:hypothetical protein [Myxococcota bacterium]
MNLSGLEIPQADRLERVVDRVRAAVVGEPFAAGGSRDEAYYRRAAVLLGWLSVDGAPTDAGTRVAFLTGADAMVRAAVDFESSTIGRAWLAFSGLERIEDLDPSSATRFLEQVTTLAAPTVARRAVTLRQWLERSQSALRERPDLARAFRGESTPTKPDPIRAFLASDLDLRLPTRVTKWALQNGLRTFGDLAAIDPSVLLHERNVGRRSIALTDDVLRGATGLRWIELHEALRGESPEPTNVGHEATALPTTWDALRASFPESLRPVSVRHVDLPTRMSNFCERRSIVDVAGLLEWSAEALAAEKNLGRGSIRQTADALRRLWTERTLATPPTTSGSPESPHALAAVSTSQPSLEVEGPWLRLLRESIRQLPPVERMVITRRAGLHGDRATLQELGEMLGVSRERARQIEAKVVDRLAKRWWAEALRARLLAACTRGPVELERLAEDELWADADTHAELLDYLCERVLGCPLRVVEVAGRTVLAAIARRPLDELRSRLAHDLKALTFPVPIELVRGVVARHAGAAKLDDLLWQEVEGDLVFGDDVVLGLGGRRNEELLAFLRGSPEPVPVRELEGRFGRGHLPDEVIHVERGVVGLPSHVPDFELWTRRLVPLCVATILQDDPSRQWSVVELLDQLSERVQLPEWLGHWHLASMIRVDGTLRYLGRLRVALDHRDAPEERTYLRDVALQVLRSSGAPMRKDLLYATLTESAACSELAFTTMVLRAPFVPLDDERIGLLERDLPGGADAAAEAVEALESELEARGVGLAPAEALEVVHELEGPHASWTIEMVRSIARDAGSLRVNRSGSIGLAEWDDEQIPTRRELVRELVRAHDGRVAVETVQAALETRFGGRVTRATLYNLAHASGAQLRGDEVIDLAIAVASTPPPAALPDPVSLPGFPRAAVEPFARGLDLALDPDELAAAVERHLGELEEAHRTNEFLDPREAGAVAASCRRFLERARAASGPTRTLALAAVRYFILTDDAESDFEVGGLDDDMGVLDAVATHLGWLDCRVAR